jgi:hypothetical protein
MRTDSILLVVLISYDLRLSRRATCFSILVHAAAVVAAAGSSSSHGFVLSSASVLLLLRFHLRLTL